MPYLAAPRYSYMIYTVSRVREQRLQEKVVPQGPRSSQEGRKRDARGRMYLQKQFVVDPPASEGFCDTACLCGVLAKDAADVIAGCVCSSSRGLCVRRDSVPVRSVPRLSNRYYSVSGWEARRAPVAVRR